MNHVYRVVFNAAAGVWQAVSEIARGPAKSSSPARRLRRGGAQLAGALGMAMVAANAYAAPPSLYWDGSQSVANGSADGGSGIWDYSDTNWTSDIGTPNQSWNGGNAVFSGPPGTAGTVAVGGQHSITGLEFQNDGYKLVGGANGQLNTSGIANIRVNPNVTATLGVAIGGSGTLHKQDSGTLILNGNSTYTGGTIIEAGRLEVGSNTALGSGALTTLNNTVLDANNKVALDNNVNLIGSLGIGGSADLTLNGVVYGPGSLIKNGAANLTLNGANTYLSGTTLNAGTLTVGNDQALGLGNLTVGGASTLTASNAVTLGNAIALNASLTVAGDNDLTLNSLISGPGQLVKTGTGTLTLGNANPDHTGGIALSGGTLAFDNATSLGSGALVANGTATLQNNRPVLLQNAISVNGELTMQTSRSLELAGSLSGSGKLIKTGADELFLSISNTYSGAIEIEQGHVTTFANNALGTPGSVKLAAGTVLNLTANAQIGALSGSGTTSVTNLLQLGGTNADSTYAGALMGSGLVEKVGTGTLELSGNSSLNGPVTVKAGTLKVSGALNNSGVTVQSGGTVSGGGAINGTLTVANGGTLAGSGGQKLTAGAIVLSQNSNINVALGSPVAGNTALFDATSSLTLDGVLNITDASGFGTGVYRLFDYSGSFVNNILDYGTLPGTMPTTELNLQTVNHGQVNLIVDSPNRIVQFWDGNTTVPDGNIVGGSGVWTATNTNWTDYNGVINQQWADHFAVFQGNAGVVLVQGEHTVNGMQFMTDGYHLLTGFEGKLNAVNPDGGKFAVRVDPGVTATIGVDINGTGTLQKLDQGKLVLNGNNGYQGGTLLAGGTLVVGNNNALGTATLTATGGTTLDNNQALTLTNQIVAQGQLNLGGSNNLILNGDIAGNSGGLNKNGSGTLTLGGNNSFGGTMALNGGTLVLASSNPLGNSTLTAASGMQLDNSVALSLANTVNLAGDLSLVGNQNLTLDGLVNGTGGLAKRGTGKLTLNGANTFQGGVNLTGGNLAVGHDAALGEGTLTVRNAATLEASRAVTLANNVQLSAALTLDGSNDFTLNGVINGSTELIKNGAGRLTLNGENRHSGGTTVNAGDLSLGNAAALGDGMLTVTGNTQLDTAGPMRLGNTVNVDGALTVAGNNSLILDGQLNGNGTLRKTGANDLSLTSNANTFSGMIDLQGGSLTTAGNNALGQNATANVAASANLFITNLARLASLNGNGTVTVSNGNNLTIGANGANSNFGGQLNGKGWLTKSGTGSLVLSGNNTLTGQTSVSAGSLRVDGALASTNVLVYSGAALGGTGSIAGDVTLMSNASLNLTDGHTLSVGSMGLGTQSIVNASLGAPALGGGTALVNVAGNLVLGGTLNISDAGGFGTGVYRLMNYGGSLTNSGMRFGNLPSSVQSSDLQLQTAVSNQVNLLVAAPNITVQFWDGADQLGNGSIDGGTGVWGMGANNWTNVDGTDNRTWAGGFAVFQGTAGVVQVIGKATITGMQFLTDGYQIAPLDRLSGLDLIDGDLGNASIRVDPGVTATIDARMNGSSTLGKYDSGTLVLNASNGYTGGTALNGGTLVLGNDKALGNGLLTAANGTTLDSNTAVTVRNKVALNGALTIAGSNTMELNGTVGGAGGLIKNGAANLTLSGVNSYVGGTLLNAGGLIVGNGAALGSGTLTVGGAATLDNTQALALANNIALNAGLTVQGSQDLTLNGNISGAGSLTKNGASTLTLNGANSYTGGTYVNSGTVALGAGSSLAATGVVTVANGATFDLSAGQGAQVFGTLAGAGNIKMGTNTLLAGGSADGIFAGSVIGTGTLVKQGSGTQTLTGVNSYTGGTLVAGGTLRAGSATALVQGTGYQVLTGAVLDLNGNSLLASSLSGGGTVALGGGRLTADIAAGSASTYMGIFVGGGDLVKTGAGALALTGGSTFTGGVQLKQGSIALGHAQGLGTGTLAMDDGTVISLIANGMTIANDLAMTGTNDPVIDTGANTATWAGAITGGGFLTKQGTGVLTLTSAGNSYTGATDVAQGTLKAGAANTFSSASAHTVASGAVLDLAGYSQTVASLNNSGAVNLSGATPGAVLKVTGPYVGNNGKLGVSTALGADGSATDKLLLSGPSAIASGSTTVQIANAGGLGAQTGSQGIQVIATENGASLQPGSFTLAGNHVDAGAYEYRLTQTTQGAALHSTNTQNPGPGVTPAPAYREEVPLLSSLPAQLRQADMAMLGDMRKRMGDDAAQGAIDQDPNHRAWARVLRTAPTITQQGTVNPESSGHLTGFQAGVDVYADRNLKAGLYVGQLDGDMGVRGFSSGMERKYAGYNNLRGRYVGLYGTWQHDSGLYADAVIQGADYRSSLRTADTGAGATTKGHGWLASLEVGKPFDLGGSWQLEPQAQIIYRKLNLDDTTLSLAKVKNDADDDWTLRLGARVKGSYSIGGTVLQPFARVNLYKASNTTDVASFSAPAGTTDIRAKGGYTSTEFAVGAMLQLTKNTSLYGDVGKLWANSGDSRVKTGAQGSVGLKVLW